MRSHLPRNDEKYQWTNHVVQKMKHYALSEGRVRRVLASPKRTEEGVAPGTVAVMQSAGTTKKPHEIWVMYQVLESRSKKQESRTRLMARKRIITAWRYPGKSKPRQPLPIPEDILAELGEELG